MSEVVRFKRKRVLPPEGVTHAARFDGTPDSLAALLQVVSMIDSSAKVVEVPELDVAVVRWINVPDDHPAHTDYAIVERGKWLAFSEQTWTVYVTDDADLDHWYEKTR